MTPRFSSPIPLPALRGPLEAHGGLPNIKIAIPGELFKGRLPMGLKVLITTAAS